MNERSVDFVTSYNDTLKSLDSFYKKFLFFLIFPDLPYIVRTNPLISLFNPITLKTYLCVDCGFIENNLFPVKSPTILKKVENPKIYIVIIAILMGVVVLLISWAVVQNNIQ